MICNKNTLPELVEGPLPKYCSGNGFEYVNEGDGDSCVDVIPAM